MRRFGVFVSATARFAVIVLILAVLIGLPLVVIYRSRCDHEIRYSLVAPWDDPPAECAKNESGLDLIRRELGI